MTHMATPLILASVSEIRATLLRNAGLDIEVKPARIDEDAVRAALQQEDASPQDIADALAEMKSRKISDKRADAFILGCDQVLALKNEVFAKPEIPADACDQLRRLSGKTHHLLSAAVIYQAGQPLWRHVGDVRLTMHDLSDGYIEDYVARNWDSVRHSVGCYKIEEEGVRLFSRIDGNYFNILGLPLLELLNWLATRGEITR